MNLDLALLNGPMASMPFVVLCILVAAGSAAARGRGSVEFLL